MNWPNPTPKQRRYIYGVAAAVVPLLITYGVLTQEQAASWLALAGALLGFGMAYGNTDKGE